MRLNSIRFIRLFFLMLGFNLLAMNCAQAAEVTIASAAGSSWKILVAAPSTPTKASFDLNTSSGSDSGNFGYELAAAQELSTLLQRMSDAKCEVVSVQDAAEASKYSQAIVIGSLARELGAKPPRSKYGVDGSSVAVSANRVLLAGETPIASYFAMTRFAEMLGCRWYMPGELGEVIPRRKVLSVKSGTFDEVPQIWSRYPWLSGGEPDGADAPTRQAFHRWMLHNRQYGVPVSAGHVWASILPAKQYFEAHPEWYAQVGGKREPGMLCTSNKTMTQEFIKVYRERIKADPGTTWWSLTQDDGIAFCECAECTALDPGLSDPIFPNYPQISDRLVNFYNIVVTELTKEFPDKYFCFLAYGNSTMPVTREKLHPHLMPMIAPISFSRYHAMGATNSETAQLLQSVIEGWAKQSQQIAYYGYAYNLADAILPYTRESQTRHDIPFMAKNKLGTVCMESLGGWQNMLPWYYLLARLNLDPNQNPNAVLNEFYTNFFGDAAVPMRAYNNQLREAYADVNYEMGNQWYVPLVFTPQRTKAMNSALSQAERLAGKQGVLPARVAMWRVAFDELKLFQKMREQTNNFQFVKASATAQKFYDLGLNSIKGNPYSGSVYAYKFWWKSFWKDQIDFSAQHLKGAKIAYKFPNEWHAFVDYSRISAAGNLQSPSTPLTRWQKLKTYSKTIGEQGLTRFRGTIWYRHDFTLPAEYSGQPLHLLFAGVDNKIDLYINGRKVGTNIGGSFDAFDFDVSAFIKPGANTVVAAISNEGVTELETGGIMRPVVLYQPAP